MEQKNFLIIGAGELQVPLIQSAKKLGHTVVVSDKNPVAVGFQYADYSLIADTLDAEETLNIVMQFIEQNFAIHGVATSGTDASHTVAVIAEALKLPGHSVDSALKASNKHLMRNALHKHNVSIPKFKYVISLEQAFQFFEEIKKPCVIKPLRNMGARGTSLVSSQEQLEDAFNLAIEYSHNAIEVLIEEYIEAKELSIDALIHDGFVTICGIADRIIEYSPYFVETGHILPSSLPQEWLDRAVNTFCQGIKALGLSHGAAKGDIKVSEDNVWVIEIAARLSGGFMSAYTFPLATGIPLQEYMVKLALGESFSTITPTKNFVSIERAIIAPSGKITRISIPEDILEQQYISHISVRGKVGDIVVSPKNNLDKFGNIIATAPTKQLAIEAINKALRSISITTESSLEINSVLEESLTQARSLLSKTCAVCRYCDGVWCRGRIPGVGGVASGQGFIGAYERYREIKLLPQYIHDVKSVDTQIEMFGKTLSMPIFVAPIGGASVNYPNTLSELELQRAFVRGARMAGTLSFIPDPAPPELFTEISQVILENFGECISICKPRKDLELVEDRFKKVLELGAIAYGTDIDGIGLATFTQANQETSPKSESELIQLRTLNPQKPFVVKGILNPQDALKALSIGATHLIVSSHGGRINEAFPNPIDMLPAIREVVQDKAIILIDGAIRFGSDIAKALILGADGVLVGRPVAIHAIGGGYEAVRAYLFKLKQELETTMLLLGVKNIHELKGRTDLLIK